jgi:hypothetical protein
MILQEKRGLSWAALDNRSVTALSLYCNVPRAERDPALVAWTSTILAERSRVREAILAVRYPRDSI